jgi:hypothetical protein
VQPHGDAAVEVACGRPLVREEARAGEEGWAGRHLAEGQQVDRCPDHPGDRHRDQLVVRPAVPHPDAVTRADVEPVQRGLGDHRLVGGVLAGKPAGHDDGITGHRGLRRGIVERDAPDGERP